MYGKAANRRIWAFSCLYRQDAKTILAYTAVGKYETIKEAGFTPKQVERFQTLAKHPEIVAQAKAEAVLDAEVRIGELMAKVPKASGGDRKSESFQKSNGRTFETKAEAIRVFYFCGNLAYCYQDHDGRQHGGRPLYRIAGAAFSELKISVLHLPHVRA